MATGVTVSDYSWSMATYDDQCTVTATDVITGNVCIRVSVPEHCLPQDQFETVDFRKLLLNVWLQGRLSK